MYVTNYFFEVMTPTLFKQYYTCLNFVGNSCQPYSKYNAIGLYV